MGFIDLVNVTKAYRKGDREVVPIRDLSLSIRQGEAITLMGPSGSGKTTLLNLVSGIDRATSGAVKIADVDLGTLSRRELASWRAHHVGYIFQLYHLIPVLTAFENVEMPLLLHRMSRRERHERVALALELVGLADRHDHYPRQLSGGQEQRVAIARALVADPAILVADEPTGDLDREAAEGVLGLLSSLHRGRGKTLIMVTHDPHVGRIADRTVHLEKGVIVDGNGGGSR